MLVYRGMTFCEGDGCTRFGECPRSLTDEVKAAATRTGLLVSRFADPKAQGCYRTAEARDRVWCAACGRWSDHASGTCPTITH
jgi:hypothetical protein